MADYDLQYQDTHIDALLATANELKTAGYIYKGVATPSTNPGTPTERVAYLASEPGTYTNFGGIVITSGLYSLTYVSGTWTGTQMQAGSDIEVVQTTGQSASNVMSQKAVTDLAETCYTKVDISSLRKVDGTINASGNWDPTKYNVAGRSIVIECPSYELDITITITTNILPTLSFLKSLPNSFSSVVAADFADGETGRRALSSGINILSIPSTTKYIVIACETSTGTNITPSKIVLHENNSVPYAISTSINKLEETSYTNADISSLRKVNGTINASGNWDPTRYNVAGRSIIVECPAYELDINIITITGINTISFLKSLPNSFSSVVAADFADGETGRRSMVNGFNTLNIPTTTRYIAINCETSTGVDITPSKIILHENNSVTNIIRIARNEVTLKGQSTQDNIIYLDNMINVTPVSDPLKALASGECNVYHEVATGLVYFTAIEGFDHPYEAYDCVALYVFSLTNPNLVKRFEIAKASDKGVQRCYTPNLVAISNKVVRVFYTFQNENNTDGAFLYYKDFDFSTETFSTENKTMIAGEQLTAAKIREYTLNNGGVDTGKNYVYIQKITERAGNGYRYCTLNCGESTDYNIVVARSNDNFATLEFIAITPFRIRYDCAINVISSKLYFVFRIAGNEYASTSGTSLCTADINASTIVNWSTPIKFAEGDSRPDCYIYNGKVYMMAGNLHSVQNTPVRISSSVWEGTSSNPADYVKVLVVEDSRGVQNPRVFRYGCGDYGVLMQNSPARVDYENGQQSQWQFKTAVCYVCTRIN